MASLDAGRRPVCLAPLFLAGATTPAVDPILVGIFVVLAASAAGLIAVSSIGAAEVLALGWSLVAAIFVIAAAHTIDRTPSARLASAVAGGLVLGVALIAVFAALSSKRPVVVATTTCTFQKLGGQYSRSVPTTWPPPHSPWVCTIGDHLAQGMAGVMELR